MNLILFCIMLLFSLTVASQDFELVKDTIYVGEKDSIISVPFKLKGTLIQSKPRVSIKKIRGSAIQGRDFDFLDGDGLETFERKISIVLNNSGEFKMKVAGGISTVKNLKLKVVIAEGGAASEDIALLFLAPKPQKSKEEIKKPELIRNDSLEFIVYLYNNIDVHLNPPVEISKKIIGLRSRKTTKDVDQINVDKIKIDQIDKLKYRIQIITTDNEVFFNTVELTTYYQFKEDDKVFLFGKTDRNFMHLREIIVLNVQDAGDKPMGTPEILVAKFKL